MTFETHDSRRKFTWNMLAIGLIALGAACSAYLLLRYFAVATGGPQRFNICQAVFGVACDEAGRKGVSLQLGIPLAGWGLIHFTTVAVLLSLSVAMGKTFQTEGVLVALALCAAAAVFGGGLTWIKFSAGEPTCPLCVVVHAVNLLLVPVLKRASGRTWRALFYDLGRGVRYVFGGQVDDHVMARWKTSGLITAALVGVVMYQWVLIETDRNAAARDRKPSTVDIFAEFEASETREIPVSDADPQLGAEGAALQVVLFSDFECPACARFAHALTHMREDHPEAYVVFKHYPLGTQCNAGVDRDLHPLSCAAAEAAEAARRQGKFWEYHNALFATSTPLDGPTLKKLSEQVGLDAQKFDKDLADPSTKAKVQEDIALGEKLDIHGTPSVFVNGKPVSDAAMNVFEQLVVHELQHKNE